VTLIKSISNDENRFKRINVQKIASLKDLFNKPVSEITFNLKSIEGIDQISKLITEKGETGVKICIIDKNKNIGFKLKNKRLIDRKAINLLRNENISSIIE
jgi:DNA polymerase-3 subunit alpha